MGLEVEGWFGLENSKRKTPGTIRIAAQLNPNEDDNGLFQLFVKNLDIDNNWVVIDPSFDAFEIADRITGEEIEEKAEEEKEEVKKEQPEEPQVENDYMDV